MRLPPFPSFTKVATELECQVTQVQFRTFLCRQYQCRDAGRLPLLAEVAVNGCTAQVCEVKHDQIVLQFRAEDQVIPFHGVLRHVGQHPTPSAVQEALSSFWHPIWMRDSEQEETDIALWPRFQELVRDLPSPVESFQLDLSDPNVWLHVVRSLSLKRATGVSGWSNGDLRSLPDDAIVDLSRLVASSSAEGFSRNAMQARVSVLSKVEDPVSPSQARPITILCNLYRVWARVVVCLTLDVWSQKLPRSVMGCVRGRSSSDLAYNTSAAIEKAMHASEDLSGLAVDLVKAFNLLARAPLGWLLQWLGLPRHLSEFWLKSLRNLTISFHISGSLSGSLPSTTGAPEGDPISVLAMIGVCTALALLLTSVSPSMYMDNWSWMSCQPSGHQAALLTLQDFTASVRLRVDWKKSYAWAIGPVSKKWFRRNLRLLLPPGVELGLQDHIRELGVQLQFNKRHCLHYLTPRLEDAARRLRKLFHDPSPMAVKARVVQSGVWPFACFGSFNSAPGKHHMHRLRSLAARAMVGRHHSMSSYAAMHIVPGVMDPETYLMWAHSLALRRAFQVQPEVAEQVLAMLVEGHFKSPFGPASALWTLLERNEWVVLPDGSVKGPGHWIFSLRTSCPKSIRAALEGAWALKVQEACLHRTGLAQLQPPCKLLTTAALSHFPPWKQQILARHMSGAFMSGAEKSAWSSQASSECPLCGCMDTKHHRLYTCEALSTVRESHKDILEITQKEFPLWTHLLVGTQHPEAPLFRLSCQSRRLPPLVPSPPSGRVQIFTDGSARHPSCPSARLTYWAVICSTVPGHETSCAEWRSRPRKEQGACFRVLMQGCTPGSQTVPRAELSALAWVARWLKQSPLLEADVFTDSSYVVSTWSKVQQFQSVGAIKSNTDLAAELLHCPGLHVWKVKAHVSQDVLSACSDRDAWMYAGNAAADCAARGAKALELSYMAALADTLLEHHRYQLDHLLLFCDYLIDVNVADIRFREAAEDSIQYCHDSMQPQQADRLQRSLLEWTSTRPTFFPEAQGPVVDGPWGTSFMTSMCGWLLSLEWPAEPRSLQLDRACPYVEMMVHFVAWSNILPPTVIPSATGRQFVESADPRALLQPRSLATFTGVFQEALLYIAKRRPSLVPALKVTGIPYLRALGLKPYQSGLDRHPLFPPAQGWIPLLVEVCRLGCYFPLVARVNAAP